MTDRPRVYSTVASIAFGLSLLVVITPGAVAQTEDLAPPTLPAFSFSPASIDVTSGPATVTISAHITDDLSGYANGFVLFTSPSGSQSRQVFFGRVSGTPLDGQYQASGVFPQFSEAGIWKVSFVYLVDGVSNSHQYSTNELTAAGFQTTLDVTATTDSAAPGLPAFSFSPASIDVTSGPATVIISAHITDDLSGYANGFVLFTSPSGAQSRQVFFGRVSGTPLDGQYQASGVFPQFSEAGIWKVSFVYLVDGVSNSHQYSTNELTAAGFQTTLDVTATTDSAAPGLPAFSFSPASIDVTSGPATVIISAHITDDLSGYANGFVLFTSPSGAQSRQVFFGRVSGTPLDGQYQGTAVFPQFSEAGTWSVTFVYLVDGVGNNHQYSTEALTSAGFQTTLVVSCGGLVNPSISLLAGSNPSCPAEIVALDAGAGYSSYFWSTGETTQSISVSPTASTTYTVTVTGAGCSASAVWNQTVTTPTALASGAATIALGGSAPLVATGGDGGACTWSPTTGLDNVDSCTPNASPTTTTTYTVTVYVNGCPSTNAPTVTITVVPPSGPQATSTTLTTSSSAALTTAPPVLTATVTPVTGAQPAPPAAPPAGARSPAPVLREKVPSFPTTPEGQVEFFMDGASLGRSNVFLKNGSYIAVHGGASLPVGTHTLTAQYLGNPSFDPSTSPAISQTISQGTYFAVDLGTLGGTSAGGMAVNESGAVAGWSNTSNGTQHAFEYSNGTMTDLGTLGGPQSIAWAIGDNGIVVGGAYIDSLSQHAFVYTGGSMIDLGTLGGTQSFAQAINDAGQVAGTANLAGIEQHAFLYEGNSLVDLGALGGRFSVGRAINSSGEVVGSAELANGAQHAFIYDGAGLVDLRTLGGRDSYANAVNDAGEVAGSSNAVAGDTSLHAFVTRNGTMIDLGTFGGAESRSWGINNQGEVVGTASTFGSAPTRAFLYVDGMMQNLGTLGGVNSSGSAISEAGVLTGAADVDGITIHHAFTYGSSALIDLGTLGGANSYGQAINDAGQVTGSADAADGTTHAALWTPVPMSALNVATATGPSGGVVTLSATLSSAGSPVPGKMVVFSVSGSSAGSALTDASGLASLAGVSIATLAVGTYPGAIVGTFAGDPTLGAASGTADLAVLCTPPIASVTGTATIVPGGSAPLVALGGNSGSCTWVPTTGLDNADSCAPNASPAVTTTYTATVYMDGCASTNAPAVTITVVTDVATTTTLSTSLASTLTSAPPVFTATVMPTPAVLGLNGQVDFVADGVSFGRSPVFLRNGQYVAVRGGATLSVGTHSITANYLGDASFRPSNSAAVSQTINPGTYFTVDLGTLGGERSLALSINSSGMISGSSHVAGGAFHGMLISGGVITDLGTLGGDASANSINDAGVVVGYSYRPDGTQAAVKFSGGSLVDLGSLGGGRSDALAINNGGLIVGWSRPTSGGALGHAVVFHDDGSSPDDLGTFGGTRSDANAANDAGVIVGEGYYPGDSLSRAAIFSGGSLQDLGSLGSSSAALGVNNAGQIVGITGYPDGVTLHAFLDDNGAMADIGSLGGRAWANTIGDGGRVVGYSYLSGGSGPYVAFVWDGSALSVLPGLGGSTSAAYGINAVGQIVGEAYLAGDATSHATLWQPVPVSQVVVAPASGPTGGTVTLSATLMSQGSPVSGKAVSFTLSGSAMGSATTDGSGVATLSGVSLGGYVAGGYPGEISASFAGDVTLGASSGTGDLTVSTAPTTTVLTSNFTSAAQGQSVKLTATVSPAFSGSPTGVLTFKDGPTVLAAIGIDGPPVVVFTTSSLSLGSHSLVVSYAGDGNFQPSTSNTLTVTIVAKPDYRVTAASATGPVGAGQPIAVTDTTKNFAGGAVNPGIPTAFYLSTDPVLDGADLLLGSRTVPALASGITSMATTTLTIPAGTPGNTYYIISKADGLDQVPETIETNNTRATGAIKIGPDLSVATLTVPSLSGAGYSIAINDTTSTAANLSPAPASTTSFYLSTDTTLDAADVLLGSRPVGALIPGGSESGQTTVTIPTGTATGTYRIIAKADGPVAIFETSETNNTRASGAIKIGPELTVSSLVAPASSGPGLTFAVTDTTSNGGGGDAGSSTTGYFLSTNNVYDGGDVDRNVGGRSIGSITAGSSSTVPQNITIPPDVVPGNYFLIAVSDVASQVAETNETNNTRAKAISIGPDLVVVSPLSSPASGTHGATVNFTVKTRNTGGSPTTAATTTRVYISSTTSPSGPVLASRTVTAGLGVGATDTSPSLAVALPSTPGSYFVVVVSDDGHAQAEFNETNNITTKAITVN